MRVLLAYDASDGAQEAAALVTATRWPSGSAVRVVAVMEPPPPLIPGLPMSATRVATSPDIEAQIVDYLQGEVAHIVERLRTTGIAADGVVLGGRPATVLVDEARRFQPELVMAGSRGHGPIATLVLGSVSAELVDHAPCPVLVTRRPTAQRVLFATDGSQFAARAEEIVAQWPIFANAQIRVVSVAEVIRPWHAGIAPTMYRQVMDAYAKDLDVARTQHTAIAAEAAARLAAVGRTADATLRVGDAAGQIIEEASTWAADVVVVGSRGLTGMSRLVLGSVARNVLQGSPSSVLVVRDAAHASTKEA